VLGQWHPRPLAISQSDLIDKDVNMHRMDNGSVLCNRKKVKKSQNKRQFRAEKYSKAGGGLA